MSSAGRALLKRARKTRVRQRPIRIPMKQARFVLQGVSRSVRSREGAWKEPGGRRSTTIAAGLAHEDGAEDEVATENPLNLLSPSSRQVSLLLPCLLERDCRSRVRGMGRSRVRGRSIARSR